jgi:flagellar hook assembly protein FlgD
VPSHFELMQNYPNPFNPSTAIHFELDRQQSISVRVYDSLGRLVRELVNDTRAAGPHTLIWDGKDQHGAVVPAGLYFARLATTDQSKTIKMLLVK